MGHALKRAVAVVPQSKEKGQEPKQISSPLMNSSRRRIFQHLCRRPFSTVGDISSVFSVSRATITWHLNTLIAAEYIEALRHEKKIYFFPKNMISGGKTREIILTLTDAECNLLFKAITDKPGADRKQLDNEGRHNSLHNSIKRLEKVGLISIVKDGRHVRYFPTDLLSNVISSEIPRQKAFRRTLVSRMENEQLKPKIEEIKGKSLMIIVQIEGKLERIELPFTPIRDLLV